jgi:Na+-transporting NADH:ubiquinone oxidoreductase subunit NqrE
VGGDSFFVHFKYHCASSEVERIEVFQALKETTSVKCIRLSLVKRNYTKRSAEVVAEYLESSRTLQKIAFFLAVCRSSHEICEMMISVFLRALSRNTSVTKPIINIDVLRFSCVAFQELLMCTQTLQTMEVIRYRFGDAELNEVQIAAITSGFANNTTLRDLKFRGWREADLAQC